MNKELHQAAIDALQAYILDVLGSTAKDKYIRVQRLCNIAALLQREGIRGVSDALATAGGGIQFGEPNMVVQQQLADYDPAPFVNGFDQSDNGEIERNKMLSIAQLTHILKDQIDSQKRGIDSREEEGFSGELANLIDTRNTMEDRGKWSDDDVATHAIIKERINYITKRLKEKTDASVNKSNSSVVHPELVRGHSALDGRSEDVSDGGAAHANGGVGAGGAAEEGVEAGMEAGAVVRRERLCSLLRDNEYDD